MLEIGITDHLEGPRERASQDVFREVADLVELADGLGVRYAWFAEHHAHAHRGHLPTPLLYALHLAGRTRAIALGTAVICLNLHHPLDVAEQVAVADVLSGGRMAVGFGSGSTPEEFALFGLAETGERERHERFEDALRIIKAAWSDGGIVAQMRPRYFNVSVHRALPAARADLAERCWVAVNSLGAARIAGALNFNVLFSHLRTVEEHRRYLAAYREAGGQRRIAANRPVYVGEDDADALATIEPALRLLWRRFKAEGKIGAKVAEPASVQELCGHPINFLAGGPETVARQLEDLRGEAPFDVANLELRWEGLGHEQVVQSLQRLMEQVAPRVRDDGIRPLPSQDCP